ATGTSTYVWKKKRTVVREKTLEPVKPPSPEDPSNEEKTTSLTPEFSAKEEEKGMEEPESEDTNDLNAYLGEKDDDEEEELEVDQEPINVHDLGEEGAEDTNDAFIFVRRKGTQGEEGAQNEERSEGASTKEPDMPKLTQEEVTEKVTREVEKIINTLVEEELERSAELVLGEFKEEQREKSVGSTKGPTLSVTIPKGVRMGSKCAEGGRITMGYIDDPNKVLRACF
ncbi:hypothetical protein KI387_008301, partial [Taxus chinensis]